MRVARPDFHHAVRGTSTKILARKRFAIEEDYHTGEVRAVVESK
jgi:hypothetical protein